jgi:hypothetical protein
LRLDRVAAEWWRDGLGMDVEHEGIVRPCEAKEKPP